MRIVEAKTLSSSKRYSRWAREAIEEIRNGDIDKKKINLDYDDVDEAVEDLTEEFGEVERWDSTRETEWYWNGGDPLVVYVFKRLLEQRAEWVEKVAYLLVFDLKKQNAITEARHLGGMTLDDFSVGDTILVTTKTNRGTERRIGRIRHINDERPGLSAGFVYYGIHHPDYLSTGQGHMTPEEIGKHPFGIMHVQVVARGNKFSEDLSDLDEARYQSGETEFKCKECGVIITGRDLIKRPGVKKIRYCPSCGTGHHVYSQTLISPITGNAQTLPADLAEARYHNNHPVVLAVKQRIDGRENAHWMDDFWEVSYAELAEVVDAFTGIYGKPQFYSDESWMWIIKERSTPGPVFDVEYTIDIRQDPDVSDKWGVDLIGGPQ